MKSLACTTILAGLLVAACNGSTGTGPANSGPGSNPTAPRVAADSAAGTTAVAAAPPSPPVASTGGSTLPAVTSRAVSGGTGAAPAANGGVAGAAQGGAPAVTPSAMAGAPATAVLRPGTVTLTTDSFVLKAGQEIYKCQNFDNPFGKKDTAIQHIETDMAPGSHHLHVYHMTTSASRKLEDCTISDFHPLLFAAGSPHAESTYPAGMASKLLGTAGVRIQLHYINTTSNDLTVNATLKLSPVDYASVTKWVSELYFNQVGVKVPPGASQSVTTSCAIPQTYGPIGLVSGGTHMHKRGVRFVAMTSTGAMLADVDTWDEPPGITYDPPVMLNPGDKITWTCTYDNNTGKTLTFGESAENNEMCIYLARFFSAPDGAQLECQATGPTGTTSTRTY